MSLLKRLNVNSYDYTKFGSLISSVIFSFFMTVIFIYSGEIAYAFGFKFFSPLRSIPSIFLLLIIVWIEVFVTCEFTDNPVQLTVKRFFMILVLRMVFLGLFAGIYVYFVK